MMNKNERSRCLNNKLNVFLMFPLLKSFTEEFAPPKKDMKASKTTRREQKKQKERIKYVNMNPIEKRSRGQQTDDEFTLLATLLLQNNVIQIKHE